MMKKEMGRHLKLMALCWLWGIILAFLWFLSGEIYGERWVVVAALGMTIHMIWWIFIPKEIRQRLLDNLFRRLPF